MTRPSVAIVGAGLGGLCAGIRLKQSGFDTFSILEKAAAVGGTWRDNSYPGCCCDVPVVLYQFSFAPSASWSHVFPRQGEMQRYCDDLVRTFELQRHLSLGEEITSAVWDETRSLWRLTSANGATHESNALVAALGQLNRPLLPQIEGRDSFRGPAFHSARWDHSVDLAGKRVAVIGSAASAVQIIPEVAQRVQQLIVFQRTPNWIVPRLDRAITAEESALVMTAPHVAGLQRELLYQNADHLFWQAFSWTPQGREAYTRIALNHLAAQVPDEALRRKLTPAYPIGCKRVLFADDYYPALQQANVTLETRGIARISPEGIELTDGTRHPVDVIVYATGFETTGWHWSMDVVGRDGVHLHDAWSQAPEAYLGITVAQFPNFFVLYGPNTNLGHNSITFMLERQVEYVLQVLKAMESRSLAAVEVRQSAQERVNRQLQQELAHTTWADPHCRSWYKNESGVITQNWSSHTRDYAKATEQVVWDDYATRAA
jgi:cation diffusion facilitator CzcD-associated flavoprotein CzcO